jgi:hypothetical protein
VAGEDGQDSALVANAMPHSATVELSSNANDDLKKFADEYHQDLGVNDTQKLLIGFGWVLPEELQKFRMHPEVLHFDAMKGTNKEKLTLLTICGRNTPGKMYTLMRVFLPNKKAWAFLWLFKSVLPTLLGAQLLRRVNIMMTDGDAQETLQLDSAIRECFPQVRQSRCGWHIVDRGWTKPQKNRTVQMERKKTMTYKSRY